MSISFLQNGLSSYLNKRAISKPLNVVPERISEKPEVNIAPASNSVVVMSGQNIMQNSSAPKTEIQKNQNSATNSSEFAAASYQRNNDVSTSPATTQDIYILV